MNMTTPQFLAILMLFSIWFLIFTRAHASDLATDNLNAASQLDWHVVDGKRELFQINDGVLVYYDPKIDLKGLGAYNWDSTNVRFIVFKRYSVALASQECSEQAVMHYSKLMDVTKGIGLERIGYYTNLCVLQITAGFKSNHLTH